MGSAYNYKEIPPLLETYGPIQYFYFLSSPNLWANQVSLEKKWCRMQLFKRISLKGWGIHAWMLLYVIKSEWYSNLYSDMLNLIRMKGSMYNSDKKEWWFKIRQVQWDS